jgi:electron-transferring-flavoprotein dehydrogenase
MTQRESESFDVVIVGAGPAGLATAIRLKQLAQARASALSVCVLEKGPAVGAHILSGAVLEPRSLHELLPDWRERGAPVGTPAVEDRFLFLTRRHAFQLPTPPAMHNEGNYIISLGNLCQWLAAQAEALGVEIYPGFSVAEILRSEEGGVIGVATQESGRGRDGQRLATYQPGMELHARQTVFAEGCRGSLTKMLWAQFGLREGTDPQTYGLGLKELWEVPEEVHEPGLVMHTIGWPLDRRTYGGSFLYHASDRRIAVGFVVGLDYENPHLDPFEEFQRFKTHPAIRPLLENGRRIAYGAKSLSEGGIQSLPRLTFPGGLIVGDAAGFLNVPKIKGTHTAMKSGMVAAEAIFDHLQRNDADSEVADFPNRLQATWLWDELYRARNVRPAFQWGLWAGLAYAAADAYLFRGRAPWTLHYRRPDHLHLKNAKDCRPTAYPKPDNVVTFDKLSSVFLSNTNHEQNQPCHLRLADPDIPIRVNLPSYEAPEQRYCPAGVYELIRDSKGRSTSLQINAQNCLHCKTCDIKDPLQNIDWIVPEGGGGPIYPNM